MKTVIKQFHCIILIAIMGSLVGCNTVAGFGQDMQQGGKELQKSAQSNK